MSFGYADFQPPAFKIEMDILHIDMGNFACVETEPLQDEFRVRDQAARAKLGARVTRFFEDQDAGREMRSDPLEMQCGGEPARSPADNDNVMVHANPSGERT